MKKDHRTAAGHGDKITFGDGWFKKKTNVAELRFYDIHKDREELSDVIAKCFEVFHDRGELQLADMTDGIAQNDLTLLDIKLGSSTVSYRELVSIHHNHPKIKSVKLKFFADMLRGSRSSFLYKGRGYTLAGYKKYGQSIRPTCIEAVNRTLLGMRSRHHLREAIQHHSIVPELVRQLTIIKDKMMNFNYTFVACSVLISINEKDQKSCIARLIDFAHPIKKGDKLGLFPKYHYQLISGLSTLIDDIKYGPMWSWL